MSEATPLRRPFTTNCTYNQSGREDNRRAVGMQNIGGYWRPTSRDMRAALTGLTRYLATPRVSKYRVFVWLHLSALN